jgi:hypothetical protein
MNDWQSTCLGRRSLPRDLSDFEIEAFFTFSEAERRVVEERRSPVLKLALAILELKFRRIRVLSPIGKQSRYPNLELTVLHATERGKPRGRDPIVWKLITDLPVTSRDSAIEKLQWYAMRWKIETFHKIMKSGCR